MELAITRREQRHRRLTKKGRPVGISESEKTRVTAACQRFIDDVLKPKCLPAIRPTPFNYPIDIHGKWRGRSYSFIQRYRSGFPENLGEEFDSAFTRLDWIGHDRFDIQWHRHTGAWFRLYRAEPLAEALKIIEADGHLHPL